MVGHDMRLRAAQGKLKVEHSIIEGLRPALESLLESHPDIRSIIPGVIRPVRNARGQLRLRITTPTPTGWKGIALAAGARQEVFFNTSLTREQLEAAITEVL
jgi:hypothetical protein